jgi:hypothetical protein
MKPIRILPAMLICLAGAGAASAADLLPLKNGIFVPAARPCKGASNADMVNYLGGRSSIGASQATCRIKTLKKAGNVYTVTDECTDLQSGDVIPGEPTAITIASPSGFRMNGQAYRYCGPRPQ